MLRLDAVRFGREGRVILDDVSLAVGSGEVLVVRGDRAAGHSTLLRIAAGRQLPDRGAVWIGSRDIAGLQRSSWPFVRRNVGYLAEDLALIDDETALENVALALAVRGEPVAAALELAARALAALAAETLSHRTVATLAGDERRLVAIARTMAAQPPVVVLDDPTAGLRAADRDRVAGAVHAAARSGAAVLVATADERFADALVAGGARSARLEDGRVVAPRPFISLVGAPRAAPASSAASSAGAAEPPASSPATSKA